MMSSENALVPSPDGAIPEGPRNWNDGYSETTFSPDGAKSGNQWEDWGKVMYQAIAPPLNCLEDVLRRTPIEDPLDQAEVNVLWPLMIEEITCPASQYNLELRLLQNEIRIITEVLSATAKLEEDEMFNLDPSEWSEFGTAFYGLPLTRRECSERLEYIKGRIRELHNSIEYAKSKGVYYDVTTLIDWFATPPDRRSTDSPSHALAFFGRLLFGQLGIAAQNTQWAHIEAVTSRQIAPRFGGDPYENEKTRFRNVIPGMGANAGNGQIASNAPR